MCVTPQRNQLCVLTLINAAGQTKQFFGVPKLSKFYLHEDDLIHFEPFSDYRACRRITCREAGPQGIVRWVLHDADDADLAACQDNMLVFAQRGVRDNKPNGSVKVCRVTDGSTVCHIPTSVPLYQVSITRNHIVSLTDEGAHIYRLADGVRTASITFTMGTSAPMHTLRRFKVSADERYLAFHTCDGYFIQWSVVAQKVTLCVKARLAGGQPLERWLWYQDHFSSVPNLASLPPVPEVTV